MNKKPVWIDTDTGVDDAVPSVIPDGVGRHDDMRGIVPAQRFLGGQPDAL